MGNVCVLEAGQMREENPGDVQQNEDIQLQLTKATCHCSIHTVWFIRDGFIRDAFQRLLDLLEILRDEV